MQPRRQPVSPSQSQAAGAQALPLRVEAVQALHLLRRSCRLASAAEAVLASHLSCRLRLMAWAVGVARASRPLRRRHLPAWVAEEARAYLQSLLRQWT
jgi:hypothetical protein